MRSPLPENQAYTGNQPLSAGASDFGQLDFVIRSIMGRTATTTLVQVVAVYNDGEVAPVGTLDVQPLVAQLDGEGKPTPHGTIHNVPYFRVQGGTNAVIIDPKVGDIGLAVFASHDISGVKANKAPSNPPTRRRYSMADALYIGGVLNGAPANYIRFTSTGDIELKPAATVTIDGDLVVTGDVDADGTITAVVDVVGDGKSLKSHTHGGVQTGGGNTAPPN